MKYPEKIFSNLYNGNFRIAKLLLQIPIEILCRFCETFYESLKKILGILWIFLKI